MDKLQGCVIGLLFTAMHLTLQEGASGMDIGYGGAFKFFLA